MAVSKISDMISITRCEDNLGNIWIGTFNGLNRYNKNNGLFQNHTSSNAKTDGLTHSSIWCIVKDQQGTLWLGTYFGGVNYFNPEYNIYTAYHYSPVEKKGLSNPIVGRIIEDKESFAGIAPTRTIPTLSLITTSKHCIMMPNQKISG